LRQLQGFLPGSHAAKYTFAPYFSQEIIRAGIPGVMPGTGISVFLLYALPGDKEHLRLAVFSQ
jgi:hypothetical protein